MKRPQRTLGSELASDVEGLQLVLASALGDRYRVRVEDDGSVIGLWRQEAVGASTLSAIVSSPGRWRTATGSPWTVPASDPPPTSVFAVASGISLMRRCSLPRPSES